MTEESKRIEYWNFLTGEKNQPRPKGVTAHRLAVIKPLLIAQPDLWSRVIELQGAGTRAAAEFYHSGDQSAVRSRTNFWDAVRVFILQEDRNRSSQNESPTSHRQKTLNSNKRKERPAKKRHQRPITRY